MLKVINLKREWKTMNEIEMNYNPTTIRQKKLSEGDEQMTEVLYPNLTIPEQEQKPLGKYAMMRLDYLKKHRRGTYTTLLTEAKLADHLYRIDRDARAQISESISRMAQSLGVTEEMKATDQMKWVQMMNQIKASAEEEVLNSLIYR